MNSVRDYSPVLGDKYLRTNRRGLLAGALAAAIGVALLYAVFVANPLGQHLDTAAMRAVMARAAAVRGEASAVLDTVSARTVAIGLVSAALIALLRRRGRLAVAAIGVALGSLLVTELLKISLTRPFAALGESNSLPSGHVTAAAGVVAALLLVVAPRWRVLVGVVGTAWVAAVCAAVVIAGWHRPSDVLAALLVVAGSAAIAQAALPAASIPPAADRPAASPRSTPDRLALAPRPATSTRPVTSTRPATAARPVISTGPVTLTGPVISTRPGDLGASGGGSVS